jgi:hypothetical protein
MFYSIKNLSDSVAEPMEKPWEFKAGDVPYPTNADGKNAFIDWAAGYTTEHSFLSMFEGMSAEVRVTDGAGNQPFQLHGIIADYDSKSPKEMAEHIKASAPVHYLPQWLVHTASGNSRLVWLFERPIPLASAELTKKFLAHVSKELKLGKWAAGLDVDAYGSPNKYYEVGKKWEPLYPDKNISRNLLEAWLLKSAEGLRFNKDQTLRYKIPFEDLTAEMHKKFPGRWRGELYDGARGVRFWDLSADNDSAAVAKEEGMICFTGNRAFVSWESIFGKAFVDKYEADYMAGATENSAYDGRNFWIMEDTLWTQWSKEDFGQELRCRGYDGSKARGKTHSEIDKIENTVKKTRRVSKALPFLYHPSGIITYNGEKFMNTSNVNVLQPSAPYISGSMKCITDGKKAFPFLHDLFLSMFSKNMDPEDPQLIAFLSWLKYFYQSSLEQHPGPGQALVLAGNANKGKTFTNRAVLGKLMGGYGDASAHLVDGQQWTDGIASMPIMAIDDAIATSDYQALNKFTQRIKKYTANSSVSYNAKYGATGEVPWFGRIVITCNLDPESLRILPSMDMSTRDKIMLFKTSPVKVKFKSWSEMDSLMLVELPKFARFLLEWPMPEDRISPEARFYVKPYHDRSLFDEALYQSADSTTTEALTTFLSAFFDQYPDKEHWVGTGLLLHNDMSDMMPSSMREIKSRQLSTCLGKMAKNGFSMEQYRAKGSRQWKISKKVLDEQQSGLEEKDEV